MTSPFNETNHHDDEAAFPRAPLGYDDGVPWGHQPGLTKREYTAIQLAAGLLANASGFDPEHLAKRAFRCADAMLASGGAADD